MVRECEVPRRQTGSAVVVGWSPSERMAGDIHMYTAVDVTCPPDAEPARKPCAFPRLLPADHHRLLALLCQHTTFLAASTLVCVLVSNLHGAKWSRHVEVPIDVSGAFTFDHEAQVSLCSSGIWGSLLLPDSPALTLCLLSNRQPRLRLYSGWVTSG